MKLLIIGHARHGKDTFAELLSKQLNLRPALSSSLAAAELFLFDELKEEYDYKDIEECWNDRVNHRELWFNRISDFNAEDPARLCKHIMQRSDVYIGLRSRKEFEAVRELFDLVIWVSRDQHVPPEDSGSMELTSEDADMVVNNNGTLEQLMKTTNKVAATLAIVVQ